MVTNHSSVAQYRAVNIPNSYQQGAIVALSMCCISHHPKARVILLRSEGYSIAQQDKFGHSEVSKQSVV